MYKYLLSAIVSYVFIGCTAMNDGVTYTRIENIKVGLHHDKQSQLYIDYNRLTKKALENIFLNTRVPNKIIVTEFVDISNLDNHTKMGYVLSNSIKDTLINQHKATVVEAEVSKYFKISANGLKILSRDIKKLRTTDFNISQAIVGTYTYTDKEIVIFIKLINLQTGIIKGSYTTTLPMSDSTSLMLIKES